VNVNQLVPHAGVVDLDALLQTLAAPEARLTPFSDATVDFFNTFALTLLRDPQARQFPELQALGFWMRKTELIRLRDQFESTASDSIVRAPRGLVFHVPPSNVDTIFIYSWLMSVLAGNTNIIRLSERAADAANVICRVLTQLLASADPALSRNTAIIRYGREQQITQSISAVCDVRVIWGGDASVNALRATPIPPHAKELTFPDRSSLTLFNAEAVLGLDDNKKQDLAARFYNDTFWFDQMACSSPRMVIWTGSSEICHAASESFYPLLQSHVEAREYHLPTGPRLNKLTFAYRAILDRPVGEYRAWGSEVTVLQLPALESAGKEHCGGGLLFQAWTPELKDVAAIISRRDQTITQFGYEPGELRRFAVALNGRGVDRIVPTGQALSFNRFWDGYDLLHEFTRIIHLQP
jgi:hypothetical protein